MMKCYLSPVLLILFGMMIVSCGNELDLVEESGPIPVVYGLINKQDSAQYIRVEKAFVDKETSALTLAKDPANLYFDNASVSLIGPDGAETPLSKVDAGLEGYPREDGVFANAPNYLYKVKTDSWNPTAGLKYTLKIVPSPDGASHEATTTLLDDTQIILPSPERKLSLQSSRGFQVKYDNNTASIFDVDLNLTVRESDKGEVVYRIKVARGTDSRDLAIDSDDVYNQIASTLPVREGVSRTLVAATVSVYAAGPELLSYLSVASANLGITSSQAIPTYTNIENGVGVFSSRTVATVGEWADFSSSTLDSLIDGRFTKKLNFTF